MVRPEALREAHDWLTRAGRDLEAADLTLHGSRVLSEMAAYHSQQAGEKALKAFLAAHDQPIPKTHNLDRLVQLCHAIDQSFSRFLSEARTLTPYATQFRYPGGPVEPQLWEAEESLRQASAIVAFVRGHLPVQ